MFGPFFPSRKPMTGSAYQDELRFHGWHYRPVSLVVMRHQSRACIVLSVSFLGPDHPCRDKRLNGSGGSMRSVEEGDLFETPDKRIPSSPSFCLMPIHLLQLQYWTYLFHSCVVRNTASLVDTVFDIPSARPFPSLNIFPYSVPSEI
jgi:hypothetical protein